MLKLTDNKWNLVKLLLLKAKIMVKHVLNSSKNLSSIFSDYKTKENLNKIWKKKWLHFRRLYCIRLCLLLCSLFHVISKKMEPGFDKSWRKNLWGLFLLSEKGKTALTYLIFQVLYVYKDMHYLALVTTSSSSPVPVNVFFWSYPAVTEHYKVFHASMRKSINQLVFRARDTYRWQRVQT